MPCIELFLVSRTSCRARLSACRGDDFFYVSGDTDAQGAIHGNAYIGGQDIFIMKFDTGGNLQ